MAKTMKIIKDRIGKNPDLIIKKLNISMQSINILFFETLCNTDNINDFLLDYLSYVKIKKKKILNLYEYVKEYVPCYNVKEIYSIDEIVNNLYSGFVVIIINEKYFAIEFKKTLDSGINTVDNEKVIKGPKDGFTENYQTNIGLIRKRIRNEKLCLEEMCVGEKSKTKVGILYVSDIVSDKLVTLVKEKVKEINIDSILDSNYIYEFIRNDDSLFPTIISTERPDLVSYKLLNGKIAIVVDNTPYVIVLPAFFMEFFHTMDDYYQNNKVVVYARIMRIIAFIISVSSPAIYIALITYNHEIIPTNLLINFTVQKEGVPFPTVIEALILSITFEILRETDIRSPSTLGSALSIVGALVLGDAAVNAGLVSPIMVIIIAITSISEMIFNINDVSNVIRLWRLLFMFLASIAGMIGVFIAIILLISEICSINSFGVPFLYPIAPFDMVDQGNDIALTEKYKLSLRNKLTAKKNRIRGQYGKI